MTPEAKHTPGPWSTRASRDGSGDIGITAPDAVCVIAECFAAVRSRDERAIDEAAANARLIAAAPELLECLQAARLQLTTLGTPDDDINNFVIAAINGAITKATGAQR